MELQTINKSNVKVEGIKKTEESVLSSSDDYEITNTHDFKATDIYDDMYIDDEDTSSSTTYLGKTLKENTQRSIEERTQAIYEHLLSLLEKASLHGKAKVKIYASDDTAVLFKDRRIYNNIVRRLKQEKITCRMYPVTFWNQKAHITISW